MSHAWAPDGKLWSRLSKLDEELAAEVSRGGCRRCGGRLDRADYPRKPRGPLGESEERYCRRISFCCAACRRRTTPPSVRFLGRKVYVGAVVVASCVRLLLGAGDLLGVAARTVGRWLSFWRDELVAAPFWRAARGRLMPPVDDERLPLSLLERFGGLGLDGMVKVLTFVAPMTTDTAPMAMVVR